MFNFSLSVGRRAVSRVSFRLMSKNIEKNEHQFKKGRTTYEKEIASSRAFPDVSRLGISFTTRYLNKIDNTEEIQWDWLTEELESMDISNIPTKIIQACIRLNNLDLGLRYYEYLAEKGVPLSEVDLLFFSKLLALKKSEIKKHEQLLIRLYNDIKDVLYSSTLIRQMLMEVFVEIPFCFNDIINREVHLAEETGYMPVIEKAIELNMLDRAFGLMNRSDCSVRKTFLEKYVNSCIKAAEEGTFSIDFINRLIDLCAKKVVPITHENLLKPFKALTSALNKYDSYQWSVHECELNENQKCSKCGSTLLPNNITDDEFQQLKEYFFKQSFANVYLSSTRVELQNFLEFLKTSEPYTLVIDGLNMIYRTKQLKAPFIRRTIKYFENKGYRVLTIGRDHSRSIFTRGDSQNKKAQFFFTSNISEDDLFILCAAMYGGLDTFLVTGDLLCKYRARLNEDMKIAFLRWQLSHQYVLKPNLELVPPLPHCGVSQLTLKTDDTYIWHLSQQIGTRNKINLASPINWYCLKAEKKQKQNKVT